jgi:DNA-binding transcriptional ArsR family regulator
MPGPAEDFIVMPDIPPITVSLEPAQNALNSLLLLIKAEKTSGLGDWVVRTAAALTPEELEMHELVMIGFHYALLPEQTWPSFPAYVDHLAASDPIALRDKMLKTYAKFRPLNGEECSEMCDEPAAVDTEAMLASADAYLDFLRERFGGPHMNEKREARAYEYVIDPPAMQELIVTHLRKMWAEHLAPEWKRVKPMLQDAVRAFGHVDFSAMSRLEAAHLVIGQTLKDEYWERALEKAERVIFVPTAHIGPYLGKFWAGDNLWIMFGARLPEGVQFDAPDLSRAEIIVRLSALADDNRLRILRLIAERGEQRSQDIMKRLELSQSATSRHLKQLSATGYLIERRCNGAKCYELVPERIRDTLRAVEVFLMGS